MFVAQEKVKRRKGILTVCSRPVIRASSKALLRAKGETAAMVVEVKQEEAVACDPVIDAQSL